MDVETRVEILETINRTLCEHKYVGLAAQRITDEALATSTAVHHHFDAKEELLNAFLDDLVGWFRSESSCELADLWTRLNTVPDAVFDPKNPKADGFPVAVMELKTQAPYHKLPRERFLDFDGVMREVVADIARDGVTDGEFGETNPGKIARLIATMSNGAHTRVVVFDKYPVETQRIIEDALELHLGWTPGEGADG